MVKVHQNQMMKADDRWNGERMCWLNLWFTRSVTVSKEIEIRQLLQRRRELRKRQ